jgi:hypothetical protein
MVYWRATRFFVETALVSAESGFTGRKTALPATYASSFAKTALPAEKRLDRRGRGRNAV